METHTGGVRPFPPPPPAGGDGKPGVPATHYAGRNTLRRIGAGRAIRCTMLVGITDALCRKGQARMMAAISVWRVSMRSGTKARACTAATRRTTFHNSTDDIHNRGEELNACNDDVARVMADRGPSDVTAQTMAATLRPRYSFSPALLSGTATCRMP